MNHSSIPAHDLFPDAPASSPLRWCDLDGEFLINGGFGPRICTRCTRAALVVLDVSPYCRQHLPDRVVVPNWLSELAPHLLSD